MCLEIAALVRAQERVNCLVDSISVVRLLVLHGLLFKHRVVVAIIVGVGDMMARMIRLHVLLLVEIANAVFFGLRLLLTKHAAEVVVVPILVLSSFGVLGLRLLRWNLSGRLLR